jgi:hypothetical protein
LRFTLISAIALCAEPRFQKKARGFLQGLSTDELQYIAEFLGACMLETSWRSDAFSRADMAEGIFQYEQICHAHQDSLADPEHKMILLLEYLCRSQPTHCALAVRAERL